MADEPEHTEPEEPTPARVPDESEPQWSRDLKQTIEALPGKLRATLSDDDRRSIAEHVHGLFESSGAFSAPAEDAEKETKETEQEAEQTDKETEPKKASGVSGFAKWFAGEE